MDGEFTAEALQRLTKNYEEDSDEDIAIPISKRLSLSDDGESSVDINKILSNYTSSPPAQNNKKDSENNTNTKKTRKRAPSVTKDSNNNKITSYIQSNTNKTTKSANKSKKSKTTNTGMRYGIDALLAENERYKSHQHEKHRALNELRRMEDESDSGDSDVEMQVHNVLLEKSAEKSGDIEERKQALKSHQKIQKLIAVSQEAKEIERKDQLFTKNWRKKTLELTPLPFDKKELAPSCILFTGTVPPFEKVLNRSLKFLVGREPFLKSDHFIRWLLHICCHSDSTDLVWAAHETLMEVLNNDPDDCKVLTFHMILDLISDFGADLEVIGLGNTKEGSNNNAMVSVDVEMVDIDNRDWEWSVHFPLFNLQKVLDALSILIRKDLCDLERDEKYALLGVCYHMTLDTKGFKLLSQLQRVMEALYINLHRCNELVIPDVIKHMHIESTDYRTLVQCINMTPYGTPLTRFVRHNLAAASLEAATNMEGIQYFMIGNDEMINMHNLIKLLKSIKIEQGATNYDDLLCFMNLVEIAIAVHYELFARKVDIFMKLHTTLQALSSQIKDTGGLYTTGTVLKEFIVYLCSKIILMKNGYAKQQGRQSFMQEYLTS